MKSETVPASVRFFTVRWLPWIVGVLAFVFFIFTINPWFSVLNDWTTLLGAPPAAARYAGWTVQPETYAPAYYLATFPLRWLPERLLPLSLNLFSALCAALTLGQLARSIALLPHDRTRAQRDRETHEFCLLTVPLAWIPPLLAALACGLQITFWEHATNGTVEMFDLLLFAYVIRCLLEYRIDEREMRLYLAAQVFGIGMANNFSMLAYFPLFIAALVWMRKLAFFNLQFLTRMAIWGLAGLMLYVLLPLIASMSADTGFTSWQYIKTNLLLQKQLIFMFPKKTLLLLALTSLIPVILLSIRWSTSFGDPSQIGAALTSLIFHLVHITVLVACVWVSLDPAFSHRKIAANHDFGFLRFFSFLTLYYLGALCIGYYSGYMLLAFRALGTRIRKPSFSALALDRTASAFVLLLFILAPLALIYRNLPQIKTTNGPMLRQYTQTTAEGLPKSGVLICDDPTRLWLIKAWLLETGKSDDYAPVYSQMLKLPSYHKLLTKQHPNIWTAPPTKESIEFFDDGTLMEAMLNLAKSNNICYLHPSFGYYFEVFETESHGIALWLKPYSPTNLVPPAVSADILKRNEEFWVKTREVLLNPLLHFTEPPDPFRKLSFVEKCFAKAKLPPDKNDLAIEIANWYSRALVYWGVELQKAGEFAKATPHFELAGKLNPDNTVAAVNLEFNRKHLAGQQYAALSKADIEESFGKLRTWEAVLNQYGPYDEPTLCFGQAYQFMNGHNLRQAAVYFDRVRALVPDDLSCRLWLAQLNLLNRTPDRTLELIKEVRELAPQTPGAITNLTDLFSLEATAYFKKNEPDTAIQVIESEVNKRPNNLVVLAAANRTYTEQGLYTNALAIVERQLQIFPDDPAILLNKGYLSIQVNSFDEGIKTLDRVLTIETNNPTALLNRAIAKLRSDQLDEARKDYEALQRQVPTAHQIYYGLAEIALRRSDTNTAIRHYETYLANAPTNSPESKLVADRIKEFRGEKPADKQK